MSSHSVRLEDVLFDVAGSPSFDVLEVREGTVVHRS